MLRLFLTLLILLLWRLIHLLLQLEQRQFHRQMWVSQNHFYFLLHLFFVFQLLYIRINFLMFIFSFTAFLGTFLFVLFAGIGLTALPVDLINAFRYRPVYISLDRWAKMKLELGQRCQDLFDTGKKLQDRKTKRKEYSEVRF